MGDPVREVHPNMESTPYILHLKECLDKGGQLYLNINRHILLSRPQSGKSR